VSRALSLRTWLALALTLVAGVPALAFAGAWTAAGSWQAARERARHDRALALLRTAPVDTETQRARLAAALSRGGVEADVRVGPFGAADPYTAKLAMVSAPEITTGGLADVKVAIKTKQALQRAYRAEDVELAGVRGTLFVRRDSAAVRTLIAAAAGAVALGLMLALAVTLLQRWVLRPLARLAADADRVAGGELAIAPVVTRAREVTQVGDALHGMAAGLAGALGAQAAAERERRFLLSALAHDLRTPLFILRGSLEAAERGLGEGHLERAQAKAAHLDRLIGELFAFSRAEYAGGGDELVDLAALARQAAEAAGVRAQAPQPLHVRGDAAALQRIVTNLLDNAVRHGGGGVAVGVRDGGGRVRVEVADEGPGFRDPERAFEPLFRDASAGGAGLGLAIARRLARAHGGDVTAANRPGGGAVVTLVAPRAGAPAAAAAPPARPARRPG
jgi:signal transduction histidine kinase